MRRRLVSLALALSFLFVSAPSSRGQGERDEVVLGKKNLLRYGIGWGTAHPRTIFNGGVPNGKAWNLRWTNWGSAAATAHGLSWPYAPHGGYDGKGAIELRAYRLGQCEPGGPRAYTRLSAREAVRPGGRLGEWFAWGGWRSICHAP